MASAGSILVGVNSKENFPYVGHGSTEVGLDISVREEDNIGNINGPKEDKDSINDIKTSKVLIFLVQNRRDGIIVVDIKDNVFQIEVNKMDDGILRIPTDVGT